MIHRVNIRSKWADEIESNQVKKISRRRERDNKYLYFVYEDEEEVDTLEEVHSQSDFDFDWF